MLIMSNIMRTKTGQLTPCACNVSEDIFLRNSPQISAVLGKRSFPRGKSNLRKTQCLMGTVWQKYWERIVLNLKTSVRYEPPPHPKHAGVLVTITTGSIVLRFIVLPSYCIFKQVKHLWQCCIEQVCWHHFPNRICSFSISVSHLVILTLSSFSLWWYLLWWLVVFNVTIAQKIATCWSLRCW